MVTLDMESFWQAVGGCGWALGGRLAQTTVDRIARFSKQYVSAESRCGVLVQALQPDAG
jgi:hypothetical protein